MADLPAWAADLDLLPHPEGGWYAETYRHADGVDRPNGDRSLGTAIYFLLLPAESSAWHKVASDELWFHHRGGPLRLFLGGAGATPDIESVEILLGPDIAAGQRPQLLVPADVWQAARPADAAVLVSCVVVPGFDFADFELGGPAPA